MKEFLEKICDLVAIEMDEVEEINYVQGIDNVCRITLKDGKKYILSLIDGEVF